MPGPREATAITSGPAHHFFGYYDKCPWDPSGRYVLAKEVDFWDRPPTGADSVRIGLVDLENDNRFAPVAETTAWCWQQGTMLQWLPAPAGGGVGRIIYNERRGDGYGAVLLDVESGERRELSRSVYAVSRSGRHAVCINHARLAVTRPGYGYVGAADPFQAELQPAADGVWWLDLDTGDTRLVVSLEQAVRIRHRDEMDGARHWFNHLQFNNSDTRFLFLHRYVVADGARRTRLFTSDADGADVRLVNDDDMTSHFDWRDAGHICAWARQHDRGDFYYLFDDVDVGAGAVPEIIGQGTLTEDGHCSFAHDGRWMLTDTYPNADHERTLLLWDMEAERRVDLGAFYAVPDITGEIRCDLHPRWNRDGTQICFDSVHEGSRQMYVMDVGHVVA